MESVKDVLIHYVVNVVILVKIVMHVLVTLTMEEQEIVHVTQDFSNRQHKLPFANNVISLVKIVIQLHHVQHVRKAIVQENLLTRVVSVKSDFMTSDSLYVLCVTRSV